jgi:hypothetical protein
MLLIVAVFSFLDFAVCYSVLNCGDLFHARCSAYSLNLSFVPFRSKLLFLANSCVLSWFTLFSLSLAPFGYIRVLLRPLALLYSFSVLCFSCHSYCLLFASLTLDVTLSFALTLAYSPTLTLSSPLALHSFFPLFLARSRSLSIILFRSFYVSLDRFISFRLFYSFWPLSRSLFFHLTFHRQTRPPLTNPTPFPLARHRTATLRTHLTLCPVLCIAPLARRI